MTARAWPNRGIGLWAGLGRRQASCAPSPRLAPVDRRARTSRRVFASPLAAETHRGFLAQGTALDQPPVAPESKPSANSAWKRYMTSREPWLVESLNDW